jgi:hypothetical protein
VPQNVSYIQLHTDRELHLVREFEFVLQLVRRTQLEGCHELEVRTSAYSGPRSLRSSEIALLAKPRQIGMREVSGSCCGECKDDSLRGFADTAQRCVPEGKVSCWLQVCAKQTWESH